MQALRSQMNPHFMFNTLNSINSYILQNDTEKASEYLTTFSKLMRNILENSKHDTIPLEKEIETLKMYIDLESARLEHKFDYQIIIDNKIDDIQIIPLIFQPFVENAIWHGLHNKKEKGNLIIELKYINNKIFKAYIIDDGVGRVASSKIKKDFSIHKSYGIEITISRLKTQNKKNKIEIIDLKDCNDNAKGTKVELTIFY